MDAVGFADVLVIGSPPAAAVIVIVFRLRRVIVFRLRRVNRLRRLCVWSYPPLAGEPPAAAVIVVRLWRVIVSAFGG